MIGKSVLLPMPINENYGTPTHYNSPPPDSKTATYHELTKSQMIKQWQDTNGLTILSQYGFTYPMIAEAYKNFEHDPQTLIHNVMEHQNKKNAFLKINENLKKMEDAKIEKARDFDLFLQLFQNDYAHQMETMNYILNKGLLLEHHIPFLPKFFEHYRHKLNSHDHSFKHISAQNVLTMQQPSAGNAGQNQEPDWWHHLNPMSHFDAIHKAIKGKTQANWNTVNAQGLYIASH